MSKHRCPDCGVLHELDAAKRIARLEAKVREFQQRQPPVSYWVSPGMEQDELSAYLVAYQLTT